MHKKSGSEKIERDAAQKVAIEARQREQHQYWSTVNSGEPRHLPRRDRPLRLLSLDGGGVRGLISLLILDRMMKRLPNPNAKPCDYFDLIGGTSTGGLIAIMLGRLRMSVQECIQVYENLARRIFQIELVKAGFRILKGHIFSGNKLKEAIQEVVEENKGATSTKMKDARGDQDRVESICRTFVVGTMGLGTSHDVKLFRTYDNPFQQQTADNCEIWEASRATSCAPMFFPDIQVEGIHYSDGGLGHNNPADLVLNEARSLWGPNQKIGYLLSIGTGYNEKLLQTFNSVGDWIKIPRILSERTLCCERTHRRLEADRTLKGIYHRFSPKMKIKVQLHEWDKMEELKGIVEQYLAECSDDMGKFVDVLRDPRGRRRGSAAAGRAIRFYHRILPKAIFSRD